MVDTGVADLLHTPSERPVAALRVLASGSSGNCSVLLLEGDERPPACACSHADRRVCLIDLGLSPRRTRRLLNACGLSLDEVDSVLITHFDSDHFQRNWASALPAHITAHVHKRHAGIAKAAGLSSTGMDAFEEETSLGATRVSASIMAHDDAGVAAFRIEHRGASLGYATDLGRPTRRLAQHLAGVDVLAVESNYCPGLQAASDRPEFLKRRIMGGAGHLSNQQCAKLVGDIQPRTDVVLLHLSRQCNRPALAAREHAQAPYRLTISAHDEPTPWIPVTAGRDALRRSESSIV